MAGESTMSINQQEDTVGALERKLDREMELRQTAHVAACRRLLENKAWKKAARERVKAGHSQSCEWAVPIEEYPCTCGHDALALLLEKNDEH